MGPFRLYADGPSFGEFDVFYNLLISFWGSGSKIVEKWYIRLKFYHRFIE